jgi:hypothetical protein
MARPMPLLPPVTKTTPFEDIPCNLPRRWQRIGL